VKWFGRGDVDGFFGLFVDNLLQLLLILTFCPLVCGFPTDFVVGTILPGAAISVAAGNLFYAWQARRLARATGRDDVTALPFGINTVSLVAFIFLIMAPVYRETGDAQLAWRAGLFACFLNGLMEIAGAFVGDFFRRITPRAALLSSLAGIAITFIAMGFVFQIFASPAVALVPVFLILAGYGGKVRLPFGLPAGFVAVVIGAMTAWTLYWAGAGPAPTAPPLTLGLHLPGLHLGDLFRLFREPTGWKYLAVIFPMGLFNVVGSLQCLESAEAADDRYPTRPSLLVNGLATVGAAALGSAFPTTIYIGHPGWKAMGARSGYSLLSGLIIAALCLGGAVTAVLRIIPLEAALGILLWIGVIITAQAFQAVPRPHALAVAVGLIPSLAAWALFLVETTLRVNQVTLFTAAPKFGNELFIYGMIALSQGFVLSSMILAAITTKLVDQKFRAAAGWALAGAALSAVGLIHAYKLTATGVDNSFGWMAAPRFAAAYAVTGLMFLLIAMMRKRESEGQREKAEKEQEQEE
jgi:AGZA family xanthine/uracil permease-like MFS transporter